MKKSIILVTAGLFTSTLFAATAQTPINITNQTDCLCTVTLDGPQHLKSASCQSNPGNGVSIDYGYEQNGLQKQDKSPLTVGKSANFSVPSDLNVATAAVTSGGKDNSLDVNKISHPGAMAAVKMIFKMPNQTIGPFAVPVDDTMVSKTCQWIRPAPNLMAS